MNLTNAPRFSRGLNYSLAGSNFSHSYISKSHSMVEIICVTKEEPHAMVEHEVHVDMQMLKEATFKQEGNQALFFVQRDYELPLGELQSLGGGT